jgi:hypothetical protein
MAEQSGTRVTRPSDYHVLRQPQRAVPTILKRESDNSQMVDF